MQNEKNDLEDIRGNSPLSGYTNSSSTGNSFQYYQDKEFIVQEEQEEEEEEEEQEKEKEQQQDRNQSEESKQIEEKPEQNEQEEEQDDDIEEKKEELFKTLINHRATLSFDLSSLNKKYIALNNDLSQSKEEVKKLNAILQTKNTIVSEFQKLLQGSVLKLKSVEESNISLQKKIEEQESKMQLSSQIEAENSKKQEKYIQEVKELNDTIQNYKREIEKYKKAINHNQHNKKKESAYKKQLEEKEIEKKEMQSKLASIECTIKKSESEDKEKLVQYHNTINRLDEELQTVCLEIKSYKNEVNKLKQILIYYESIIKDSDKKLYNKNSIIKIHTEDNNKLIKELNDTQSTFEEYQDISNKKVDIMYKKLISIDNEKYSLMKESETDKKEIANLKHKTSQFDDSASDNDADNRQRLLLLNEELQAKIKNVTYSLKALKDKANGYDQSSVSFNSLSSTFVSNGGYDDNRNSASIIRGIEDIICQIELSSPLTPHRSVTPTFMTTTIYPKKSKHSKSNNHSFAYDYNDNNSSSCYNIRRKL